MLRYKGVLWFLVPGFSQSAIKLLLIVVSLAFYAVSLDVISCLMTIIKRGLNHLVSNLEDGKSLEEEQD